MDKLECFKDELWCIKNPAIRKFAETAIQDLPDYFFTVPASSTGKYHPAYALGEGGLLRHTRSAVRIGVELLRLKMFKFTDDERDLALVALMLHDGRKSGTVQQTYTLTEHPILQAKAMRENEVLPTLLPDDQFQLLCDCIETHMGQWTTDYKTGVEVLRRPKSKLELFVHLCDYMASRKCLEMNFDVFIDTV